MQENLQCMTQERDKALEFAKKCGYSKKKFQRELHFCREKLQISENQKKHLSIENNRLEQQIAQLKSLFAFNEQSRKKFSENLQHEKVINEKLKNENIGIS